jgi:hypothetical protein
LLAEIELGSPVLTQIANELSAGSEDLGNKRAKLRGSISRLAN